MKKHQIALHTLPFYTYFATYKSANCLGLETIRL